MPLTEGRGTAYSTIDFETARKQASKATDSYNNRPVEGVKLADMEAARARNSAKFIAQFNADAQYCMESLLELERAADARLGMDSPGFSAAKDAVQTMLRAMPAVASPAAVPALQQDAVQSYEQEAQAGIPVQQMIPAGPPGAPQTRAQALAQLRQVAEFFRRTEPHSPVSYFADKAADAGEQDLHTWLRSVVKDSSSLAHIEELLGVKPDSD
jgi:type VI secretion system protein ImpA